MKKMLRVLKVQQGFTLLEIMIVISLLAVLGTFVVNKFLDRLDEGNQQAAKIQINAFKQLLEDYRRYCNQYPTTEQGLDALIAKPTAAPECPNYPASGFIGGNKVPADPWQNAYGYESDGRTFVITCLGKYGKEGGTGVEADLKSNE